MWNTGGWVKGLTTASVNNNCGNNYIGRAVSTVKMEFNINRISYICNGASTAVYTGGTQGRQYYVRGGVTCIAGFGTIKPIKISNGQRTLHIVGNTKIIAAFRAGNPNDKTTQINTATILQSGVADNLVTNITTDGYLMLGGALNAGVVSNRWGSPGDVSCNYDGDISEIWME